MAKRSKKQDQGEELLFVWQIAELLGVGQSLVRRWLAEQTIPSEKRPEYGSRRVAKRRDVESFAAMRDKRKGGWPRGVKRDGAKGNKKAGGDAR